MIARCWICKNPFKKGERKSVVYVPVGKSHVAKKVHIGRCLHRKKVSQ